MLALIFLASLGEILAGWGIAVIGLLLGVGFVLKLDQVETDRQLDEIQPQPWPRRWAPSAADLADPENDGDGMDEIVFHEEGWERRSAPKSNLELEINEGGAEERPI